MVKDSDFGPVLVPGFYCINQRKYITYSDNPLKKHYYYYSTVYVKTRPGTVSRVQTQT